jgi:hypothetical protein
MVAVGSPEHTGPGKLDTQVAAHVIAFDYLSVLIYQHGLYTGQGQRGVGGLFGRNAGDGRNHHAAGFGLPPGIH